MADAWVISDLHLGDGQRPGLEDFSDDQLLAAWLGQRSKPETTLVINGDFVDFLQIPVEVSPPGLPSGLLWDQTTSEAKLQRSFDGHPAVFDALRAFVGSGADLRFTIGNHDLDLVWPGVQAAMRTRLNDSDGRIAFGFEHRLFDSVHVEHGHRFTGENRPENFREFIHKHVQAGGATVEVLECVWGSRFVLDALNPLEAEHPYIDNLKPTWKIAFHMLREGGWFQQGRAKTLIQLIKFFARTGIPVKDIADAVLSEPVDVEAANIEKVFGPDEGQWKKLVADIRGEDGAAFRRAVAELSAAERAEIGSQKIAIGEPEALDRVAANATKHAGRDEAAFAAGDLGLFRDSREVRGANECLSPGPITHVVFGHTHDIVDGGLDGRLFNPGSWVERLNVGSPLVKAKKGKLREIVKDSKLFATDPRAVHVTYFDNKARVTLDTVSP